MTKFIQLAVAAALGAIASGSVVYAQTGMGDPPKARVAIYHAAPGQQVALLKWLAAQDRAAQAAGVRAGQLYAHTDGDSWDYLVIDAATTPAQDVALDAALKKMGMGAGAAQGLELRRMISSHTDTYVVGPVTAQQYLTIAGQ